MDAFVGELKKKLNSSSDKLGHVLMGVDVLREGRGDRLKRKSNSLLALTE